MTLLPALTFGGILRLAYIVLAAGALVWYVGFQARSLITGPSLTVHEANMLYESRVALIEGTAQNVTTITLNNRPIFTDDDGRFSERVVLENGYTILTLRAYDRYGRKTSLERAFVYAPAYESPEHD